MLGHSPHRDSWNTGSSYTSKSGAWAEPMPEPPMAHSTAPLPSPPPWPTSSIHPGQPRGGGRLRLREQQQDGVPMWDRGLVLLLPGRLRSCLSLPLQSHFLLPVIYCCSAESHRDTAGAGAHIKQARLSHICRQLQHYSLKPESRGRWQQARDKGEKQAAILNVISVIQRSHFSQSTG